MCDCVNDSLIEKRRKKKKRQRQAIDNKFFLFYSLTDTELAELRCINKKNTKCAGGVCITVRIITIFTIFVVVVEQQTGANTN